ncbi:MAG: hypothetical protein WBJ62_07825, partial [Coriobacteriia bacterium]
SFWTFWHPVGPPTGVDDGWTSGAIMRLHFDSVTSVDGAVGGAPITAYDFSDWPKRPAAPGYQHVLNGYSLIGVDAVYEGLDISLQYDPEALDGYNEDLRLFQWVDGTWKDITVSVGIDGANLVAIVGNADPVGPDLCEFSVQEPVPPVVNVPVYRFFRPSTGTHFYTSDAAEMQRIRDTMGNIYTYEGVGYGINAANPANSSPLYRFYNKQNGTHLYTADEGEKNNILNTLGAIYSLDGVAYNVSMTEGMPVYRFFSPSKGVHFYSSDPTEIANVRANLAHIWSYEGPAYSVAQ